MDLNINIYKNKNFDSKKTIEEKVNRLLNFGFKTIGLTVDVDSNQIQNIPNPPVIRSEDFNFDLKDITIKTRLNVKVDEHIQTHRLSHSENAKKYDLLSVEPLNDKILSHLNNGNFECDIIGFDLTAKMCPNIRRANFSIPISKGIGIEITYGNSLSDQSLRRSLFAFGQLLVEKTKSRNIILSSAAEHSLSLRAPKDVVYFGLLLGLNEDQSKASVYRNGLKVLRHSEIRKNVNIGAIGLGSNDCQQSDDKWLNKEFANHKRSSNEKSIKTKKFKK